jgi:drug/metabolite transporter (DMT)-like permease
MGEALAIAALTMFSVNVIITKVASVRLNLHFGFLISVAVNVLFGALLFGGQLLIRQGGLQWNSSGFLLFLVAGFFSTYLGRWFFFDSIAKLGPAKASVFQTSNPLFTVIIAWIFLNEGLSLLDVIAIAMILLGLFLTSYVPGAFSKPAPIATGYEPFETPERVGRFAALRNITPGMIFRSGIFLGVIGAVSYAAGNVLRGAAVQTWNEPILGGVIGASVGLVLHFFTSSNTRHFWGLLKSADRRGLLLYILSGIMTITGQICVIASFWYMPVSLANLIALSTPILVTPMSYFLLRNQEGITLRTIFGSTLVLSGITIILLV